MSSATAHARDIPSAPHHIDVPLPQSNLTNIGGKSPAILGNLFTPLKRVMSRSSDSEKSAGLAPLSSSSSTPPLTWFGNGYETLPYSENFRLVALHPRKRQSSSGSAFSNLSGISEESEMSFSRHPASLSQSSPGQSEQKPTGRLIPRNTGYTLEWTGQIPLESRSFEVKELGPALLQNGRYHITLLWSSAHSPDYINMQAVKDLEVRSGKKVLAKVADDNRISFRKDHGPATLTLTKESWLHRAKDPQRRLMWRLRYDPPRETVVSYFSSDSSSDLSESGDSRPSSRSNSGISARSSLSRHASFMEDINHSKLPHTKHVHHIQAGILSTSPEDLYRTPFQSPLPLGVGKLHLPHIVHHAKIGGERQ